MFELLYSMLLAISFVISERFVSSKRINSVFLLYLKRVLFVSG